MARSCEELASEAAAIAGAEAVSVDVARYGAVGVPLLVVTPRDGESLGGIMAWATGRRLRVIAVGGGTKLAWGGRPSGVDLVVSTARLDAVLEHRHGDLTAIVQAGATLARVNSELARHDQWLPLDPYHRAAGTIGGIVATNDSGPRRHRHGGPRDLILGVRLVRADGRRVKAGGNVVKNVAGYDLSKLVAGSLGTLAIIEAATFKLSPRAPASCTIGVDLPTCEALGALIRAVLAAAATPSAVDVEWPPLGMLLRIESVGASAEQQASELDALVERCGARASRLGVAEARERWDRLGRSVWALGTVAKIGVLPSEVPSVIAWLQRRVGDDPGRVGLFGRAGLGVLYVGLGGASASHPELITALREFVVSRGGHLVVLTLAADVSAPVDLWGPVNGLRVMEAIKRGFDPAGILCPGRGPGA